MLEAFREMDSKSMLISAQHYDPAIPVLENEAYLTSVRQNLGEWQAELAAKMAAIMGEKKP